MLIIHDFANATYEPWPGATTLPKGVSWIDAYSPTPEEIEYLRQALGVVVPSLERMSEIETSSRFYRQRDSLFVTIPLPKHNPGGVNSNHPLALIVAPAALLTVRYEQFKACESKQVLAAVSDRLLAGPYGALIALVESIVDQLADELESTTANIESYSHKIFAVEHSGRRPGPQGRVLKNVILEIGRRRDFTSLIEETLLTLSRITPFLESEAGERLAPEARARLDRVARDVASLTAHENRMSDKLQFLLDASLGLIGVEQNDIFKVLTIVSVIGIPPTLIASMYGMNFKNIPEYEWAWGYPYGLSLIFLSAMLPLIWFKYRRWW